jgi:hypothetical protein
MNHDNIMLQTQINRLQADLARTRGQGRPAGPLPQVMRHHSALSGKGQEHGSRGMWLSLICSCFLTFVLEQARRVSSIHSTPASVVEELPPPSRIKEASAPLFQKKSVIDLYNDREDVEMATPRSERNSQSEPLSTPWTTEELHPAVLPPTAVRPPTPPEQPIIGPSVMSASLSSPEVASRLTSSPKSGRVISPLVAHGISGLLSSKPSSTIRTITPVMPRSKMNNLTLTRTPMLDTRLTTTTQLIQTAKPATSSSVDEPEEVLEEGEVQDDSPLASPVNKEPVQSDQLPLEAQVATRAEPVKNAPSQLEPVPPLSLYLKTSQPIPPVPKNIPKKRPLETMEEGPIKKARVVWPVKATRLPQGQSSIGSRSTTATSSRTGTAERASTQGPDGIPKPEPRSPILPSNSPTSSRSKSTEVAASTVKPAYADTAGTASDPPPEYVGSQKQELASLITRELRKQDKAIYCHQCM